AALLALPEESARCTALAIGLSRNLAAVLANAGRDEEAAKLLVLSLNKESWRLSELAKAGSRRTLQAALVAARKHFSLLVRLLLGSPYLSSFHRAAFDLLQMRKGAETRVLQMQRPSFVRAGVTNEALEIQRRVREATDDVVESRLALLSRGEKRAAEQ